MRSLQSVSGGLSSHLQPPEKTPLRKRENDSFASPEAPLLWRQPLQSATGAEHCQSTYSSSPESSTSHFGELNFSHLTRRRGRPDNRRGAQFWIPWAMKVILASPLVVLMLWFIAVAFHHPAESSLKKTRYGVTAKSPLGLQQKHQQRQSILLQHVHSKNSGTDKILPVHFSMGSIDEQEHSSPSILMESVGMPGLQNQPLLIARSGAHKNLLVQSNQLAGQLRNGLGLQESQMSEQHLMPGQNIMHLTRGNQAGHLFLKKQQQQKQQQQRFETPLDKWEIMQGQPDSLNQNQLQMERLQHLLQKPAQPMAARGNFKQNQRPTHPARKSNLRGVRTPVVKRSKRGALEQLHQVYYYDPSQSMVEGQLQTPSFVYDEHGNEVELAHLVSHITDLYIDSPRSEEAGSPVYGLPRRSNTKWRLISTNSTSANSTGAKLIRSIPPHFAMKLNIQRPESWGESSTQDQSIIVCTMATVALLVGAVSARRLRSCSFLSSCIENESLLDEVAVYPKVGGDSYNTFGWKGDVEKFDV